MSEILPTAPLAFIDNFDSDGTNITIPIASLPGLTSDLANPNSGDIRAVITCILDKFVAALAQRPDPEDLHLPCAHAARDVYLCRCRVLLGRMMFAIFTRRAA